jgi:phage terminase large subunit-like protein
VTDIDLDAYKRWTPAAQEQALNRLREAQSRNWRPFYCLVPGCDGKPHDEWKWNHARADQHPPQDRDWFVWLLLSGRGAGKTRSGAEYVHRAVRHIRRVALVAPTGPDARDIMVEGESGLLTIAPPDFRPVYEPSKRRLTWPNGAIGSIFSAEEPERLRGPEHGAAWCDEAAFYPLIQAVWDNLLFGLRMGQLPRVVVTTTPKPKKWLKELAKDPRTRISRATTYDNLDNLSPVFAERIIAKYEGTRQGRQEIHAELLEDVEGALWTYELIEDYRVAEPPDLERIVVAIDPAGSSSDTADETGIIVAGRWKGDYYVLADRSGHYSPHGWATAAHSAYEEFGADAIVAEKNFGGEMVESTLRTSGFKERYLPVHAKKAKRLRAEPIVGIYEQHKVHHVGVLLELETEQTEWVPDEGDSPNRLDACVYALTELSKGARPASIATPTTLEARRAARALRLVESA